MRYFIEISYNGKNYHGWQIQPNDLSIQETITRAINTILRENISIVGAGRTDAGVHALQLFAHVDLEHHINTEELKHKLNAYLPEDIVIQDIFEVPVDLHARFSATSRSYEYRIWLGRNPFCLDTTWQIHQQTFDVDKMNEVASMLLEYTNFKCFSKSNTDVKTYNCNISEAKWVIDKNSLTFYITADRFLRNMVRAIVGTLVDVGLGKKSKADVKTILKSEDRSEAGFSVPARGLFLTKITYPFKELKINK